jgi:hypothetical protein
MLAGMVLAFFFRKEGPQRRKYSWELEPEAEVEPMDEKPYWDIPEPDQKDLTVVYRFKPSSKNEGNK